MTILDTVKRLLGRGPAAKQKSSPATPKGVDINKGEQKLPKRPTF